MDSFDGKIALVTGGARGIGAAIVRRLAERGATVVINCFHSFADGRDLQAQLAGQGYQVELIRASVAQPGQLDAMFATVDERHGGLDLLVNNAAAGSFGSVLETTAESLDKAYETNLKGALACAQRAHPLMVRRGGGAIVNLSSIGAGSAVGNYVTVGTSKAAVEALTRYLAAEFAADGIRVNTASGGLIEGSVAGLFPYPDQMRDLMVRNTPLGGVGQPDDLADVVLFLLSGAARWVTGQTLVADGGLSMGAAMLTPPSAWRQRAVPAGQATPGEPHISAEPELLAVGEPRAEPKTPAGPAAVKASDPAAADDAVIAVVGMGLVVPGANNPEEFWQLLDEGPELLTVGHPDRLQVEQFRDDDAEAEDKTYQTRSGWMHSFVPHPWLAEELGEDSRRTEYTTQWLRHALADALRGVALPADGGRTCCVIGYTPDGNQHLEEASVIEGALVDLATAAEQLSWPPERRQRLTESARAALEKHYPNRAPLDTLLPFQVGRRAIAGLLPDGTGLITVDTACSSAQYAVDIGIKELLEGKRDVAVCGGGFAVGPRNAVLFAKLHGLSTSGNLRPLDQRADGVLFSDGAAVVVLKRLRDARRDGDTILGYIGGVGTSSDGRGKAVYAPNVKGQRLAVQRAIEKDPSAAGHPDWIVAHATGTPAGDLCEITSLRDSIDAAAPVYVTSNKALIGHTGWAAGVVSLIQILLSFRHERILRQHRYAEPQESLQEPASPLRVPVEDIVWQPERERVASVSGFGFGGTNAHMVVHDRPVAHRLPETDDIVVTGWVGHVPGLSEDGVRAWLAGAGPGPEASFGPAYDASGMKLRMPPKVVRTVDRIQLMALRCASELKAGLGEVWDRYAATTGVFLGHMGPTGNAVGYAKRSHFDNVGFALRAMPGDVAFDDTLREALHNVIRSQVPESNEDSFPGIMPNVISARVSNYFGLNGPNMTLDMGFGSALGACQVAAAYLRAGDIDVALVGGASGNTTPVAYKLATALVGRGAQLAEGIFMFVLTRRSLAAEAGLPVLATLGELTVLAAPETTLPRFGSGTAPDRPAGPLYLGADAALAMARALQAGAGECAVLARDGDTAPTLSLTLYPPVPARKSPVPSPDQVPAAPSAPEQVQERAPVPVPGPGQRQPVAERLVHRHVMSWQPTEADRTRQEAAPMPSDAVLVTATPELLGDIGTRPGDPLVVSVVPLSDGPRRRYLSEISAQAMTAALGEESGRIRHVRVIADLAALAAPGTALDADPSLAFRLQDAFFLALQVCDQAIRAGQGTVLALFTSAWGDGVLHPYAGLFKGVLKSAYLELAGHQVAGVFTDQRELTPALGELAAESAATPLLAGAVYAGGVRHTMVATPVPAEPADQAADSPLGPDSVIVAVGGARGITAEVLKDLARRFRPVIIALGSRPLDELAAELEKRGGRAALGSKPEFVRAELARSTGKSVKEINRLYERLTSAADTLDLIASMERDCGPGKVRYLRGDVRDQAQLDAAFAEILRAHGRIDLLIHAAGVNRAGAIATKPLAYFQEVRDVKAAGYLRIRRALRGYQPRMWCGFGSVIGFTGQVGEPDYAGANDFLSTAATYQRQVSGIDEFVIGWTMWRETGMAANPIYLSFFTDGQQADTFTQMSTAEGVGHFVGELTARNRVPASVHLGRIERQKIMAAVPGFFAPRRQPAAHAPSRKAGNSPAVSETAAGSRPGRGRFYVDRIASRSGDRIVIDRLFTTERDEYLAHHTVHGAPTLPGCFVTELAAEAAVALEPGLLVTGFRNVTFDHFLKLGGATERSPRRIEAWITQRDVAGAVVAVRVTGDVVSPAGVLLVRDRVHFTATVMMSREYPPAPRPEPWPAMPETPIVDPYHRPGASVSLTGPFVSTTRTRLHPLGKKADYANPVGPGTAFEQFLVPALLLDGMARLAILELVQGRYIPTAAPRGIRRIDLYSPDNDVDLAAAPGPLELTVSPRGVLLDGSTRNSRFYAIRPDGRAALRMLDVSGFPLSYYDTRSGRHVDPGEVDGTESKAFIPAAQEAVPL